MERIASEIQVLVGSERIPLRVTDSAVEAIQGEAAGWAAGALEALIEAQDRDLTEVEWSQLLEWREAASQLRDSLDVLMECRPSTDPIPDPDAA